MGNIFARRAGSDPTLAPVMTGSHLDTQPLGGRFDGIFGVLAGLEAVRALNDAGVTTRAPIDVVVWTDEEGVRFSGMLASGVFAGVYDLRPGRRPRAHGSPGHHHGRRAGGDRLRGQRSDR
jgi:N-carbamoyl-L-amino-acid hydrolase